MYIHTTNQYTILPEKKTQKSFIFSLSHENNPTLVNFDFATTASYEYR